jgi:hypothetical protein
MLYKAAAQGARKGKRRVGAPENTANPLNAAIAQLVEHLIRTNLLLPIAVVVAHSLPTALKIRQKLSTWYIAAKHRTSRL